MTRGVAGHVAEGVDIAFGPDAVADAHSADMVEDDRSLGKAAAEADQAGQICESHEEAKGQIVLGPGAEHRFIAGVVEPAVRTAKRGWATGAAAAHAESANASLGQGEHGLARVGQRHVGDPGDDTGASVSLRIRGDQIEDVAVIEFRTKSSALG